MITIILIIIIIIIIIIIMIIIIIVIMCTYHYDSNVILIGSMDKLRSAWLSSPCVARGIMWLRRELPRTRSPKSEPSTSLKPI